MSRPANARTPQIEVSVRSVRLRSALQQIPAAALVTIVNATLMAVLLKVTEPKRGIYTWLGLTIIIAAVRLCLWWSYRHHGQLVNHYRFWSSAHACGAFAAGLAWGAGSVLLLPSADEYQLFWVFVIGGMSAGAASIHYPYWPTVACFIVPASLPLAVRFGLDGWGHHAVAAAMIIVFVTALLVTSWVASRNFGERLRLQHALTRHTRELDERKKSRDMLDDAIDAMSDGFVMWDAEDRLFTCNHQYREIYAASAPFIKPGARFEDIIREGARCGQYPQAGDDIETFVQEMVAWHRGNHGTLEHLFPDGRWILISERQTPSGGVVGIRTDITAVKRAQAELEEANLRVREMLAELRVQNAALTERDQAIRTQNVLFTAALNNMSQGLLMVDSDQRLIVCNRRFLEIFNLDACYAIPGTSTIALLRVLERSSRVSRTALTQIFTRQQQIADRVGGAATFRAFDGDHLVLSIAQRPLPDGGWVATYEDVTEQERAEGRIRFVAHHDALTELPNRVLFRSRMEEALHQMSEAGSSVALLYLDLDKFKDVNDTLGHLAGDALLQAAAKRLRNCLREADIVARLGGDEFAIGLISTDLPDAATEVAKRVIDSLSAPYDLCARPVEVGVSIGIAIAPERGADCDTLLKRADMALYQAKANGRCTYAIFADTMEQKLNARLAIETDLRLALEREEFQLAYQPFFALDDGRLCGFEALLRWCHPTRGLISLAQFIPWAEELGIINAIGRWTLRRACADMGDLPEYLTVAVNLSPVQLMDCAIVEHVENALSDFGLCPARLELEITESALLSNSVANMDLLVRLHGLGLSIALDDFGTGYSSLSHLRSFPFDKLKIDRLFVSEMETRADCAAIVSSLASLASKLGMTTVAEGVETQEQLRLVREAGCTAVQGYLLARPQSIDVTREKFLAGRFAPSSELISA
jgi:diguanylate cyclase (GGDEF)-like protein